MNRRTFFKQSGAWASGALAALAGGPSLSGAPHKPNHEIPRCRILPLPGDQVTFKIARRQPLKWHFASVYPRPFFYPFNGPSGISLTRMGHPSAPNHDHHRSIWFAHHNVAGQDFWSDQTRTQIRQKRWLAYQDSDDEALMAVSLGWFGANGRELFEQELIASVRPGPNHETFLELQSTFTPKNDPVTLGKTNFGFLAVRVAKSVSEHFGGGQLTNSRGQTGEPDIFGKPAEWMDYSGPVPGDGIEGITYFDHPDNPDHPAHWHVREDGWMGASVCMHESRTITRQEPLRLRYLLHAHRSSCDAGRAGKFAQQFAKTQGYEVAPAEVKHRQFKIRPM